MFEHIHIETSKHMNGLKKRTPFIMVAFVSTAYIIHSVVGTFGYINTIVEGVYSFVFLFIVIVALLKNKRSNYDFSTSSFAIVIASAAVLGILALSIGGIL